MLIILCSLLVVVYFTFRLSALSCFRVIILLVWFINFPTHLTWTLTRPYTHTHQQHNTHSPQLNHLPYIVVVVVVFGFFSRFLYLFHCGFFFPIVFLVVSSRCWYFVLSFFKISSFSLFVFHADPTTWTSTYSTPTWYTTSLAAVDSLPAHTWWQAENKQSLLHLQSAAAFYSQSATAATTTTFSSPAAAATTRTTATPTAAATCTAAATTTTASALGRQPQLLVHLARGQSE